MALFFVGFAVGFVIGGCLGLLLAGLLMATRDDYNRYHPTDRWR